MTNLILSLLTVLCKWYIGIGIAVMLVMKILTILFKKFMDNGMLNKIGYDESKQSEIMNYLDNNFGGFLVIRSIVQWPAILGPLAAGIVDGVITGIGMR